MQEHERAALYTDLSEARQQLAECHATIHQLEGKLGELAVLHEEKERKMVDLHSNLEVSYYLCVYTYLVTCTVKRLPLSPVSTYYVHMTHYECVCDMADTTAYCLSHDLHMTAT